MKSSVSKKSSSDFVCSFCSKGYKGERYLLKHVCKQKKRFFDRDTKPARLAFHAYSKFMLVNYRREPTYEKFMNSEFYDAFLRFGKYILDVDAISPLEYIDYMLKSTIPVDRWCRDSEYLKYVKSLTMKETPHRALERTVILMQEWAIKHEAQWQNFFREVSSPLAVQWIISGRLSPWVFLNCKSGQSMLSNFTNEQKSLISPSLNTKMWLGKFARFPCEVTDIQSALEDEGL